MADRDVDLYQLLGVSVEAGEKELNKAYRSKALQYHPDKNRDDPQAVQIFHDVKAAYDTLTDPKRRAEYNEKRKAVIAKRQRQGALSSQRKRMKSQLEKGEMAARQARDAERMRAQSVREEAARFRDEAQREEWRRDKRMRDQIHRMQEDEAQAHAQAQAEADQAASALNEVDELDRTIRVRWDNSECAQDRDSIANVFSAFGELEEVVLAPVSEHARRRHSSTKSSALLVFRSISAAHALMNVQHNSKQLSMFSRFWATDKEPQAVSNITAINTQNGSTAGSSSNGMPGALSGANAAASVAIPEISEIDIRKIQGYGMRFEDFEATTLMRMRSLANTTPN
ncbi:DnaJ-domain-containing protein [Martensiomyces pterosporus]|nr:DnaJ-domain-containing protein [Martensiomyces pterosporus]